MIPYLTISLHHAHVCSWLTDLLAVFSVALIFLKLVPCLRRRLSSQLPQRVQRDLRYTKTNMRDIQ